MMRFLTGLSIVLLTVSHVRAEHAKINLELTVGTSNVAAFVDQTPPDGGKNARPVVKANVNEQIKIQYLLTVVGEESEP